MVYGLILVNVGGFGVNLGWIVVLRFEFVCFGFVRLLVLLVLVCVTYDWGMDVVGFGVAFGCGIALLFGFRLLLRLWVWCFVIDCFGVGCFDWWFGFYCVGVGFGW